MGNWEEVEVAGQKIKVHQIKWWAWTDLCVRKRNQPIMASDLMLSCLEEEDLIYWQSIDYDPDNKEVAEQINKAFEALARMNPKVLPKQPASSTQAPPPNASDGTTPTGSPKSSDGPLTK